MNRTLIKTDLKSIAYHRTLAKINSKKLFKQVESANYEDQAFLSDSAAKLKTSKVSYARSLNIASGLLKGLNYKDVEKKCITPPNAKEVYEIILQYIRWRERSNWTLEKVQMLLS